MKNSLRRLPAFLLALLLALAATPAALADQQVRLPDSAFTLTLPDWLEYDGPGDSPDDALFAYVSEKHGLDIQFFREPARDATVRTMAEVLIRDGMDASVERIGGIDMTVYRVVDPQDPPEQAMQCIGYVFLDGETAWMIVFWYADQAAADETAEIIRSIRKD